MQAGACAGRVRPHRRSSTPLLLPPQTYCFGLAASMGAFLLGAGAKGKRYSMPNARIMIHQPLGGASGAAVDIEIQVGARHSLAACGENPSGRRRGGCFANLGATQAQRWGRTAKATTLFPAALCCSGQGNHVPQG